MNDALCCYALQTLTCTREVMSTVMSAAGREKEEEEEEKEGEEDD